MQVARLFSFFNRTNKRLIDTSSRMDTGSGGFGLLGGGESDAGVRINRDNATTIDVVYSCIYVLSRTIASLPLDLYERNKDGTVGKVKEHPVAQLIHWPNDEMTDYDLRQLQMVQLLIDGNSPTQVIRSSNGDPIELYPLDWKKTKMDRTASGQLYYKYKSGKTEAVLGLDEVIHQRGLSTNGLVGLSPIQTHIDALGLAKAAEKFGAKFFAKGANLRGVLQMREGAKLSDEAYNRFKRDWREKYEGVNNSHGTPILESGMEWKSTSISPEEAQFLETRKYQRSVTCGIYGVPSFMTNDLEKATYSNIEHQDLHFVKHCVVPWCVNIEKRTALTLLKREERGRFYFKHNVDGLLRGDFKSRMEGLGIARQNGFRNANEVRALDELNPYPGGEVFLVNSALSTPQEIAKPKEEESV